MKHLNLFALSFALTVSISSCSENEILTDPAEKKAEPVLTQTRSLDEVYDIAAKSLIWLDRENSRSSIRLLPSKNEIKVLSDVKSRGEGEDTLMYVVNFQDEQGFAIIPANRNMPELLAVTESGSYDPNVGSDIEPFNDYIDFAKQALTSNKIIKRDSINADPVPMMEQKYEEQEVFVISRGGFDESLKWGVDGIEGEYYDNHQCSCGTLSVVMCMAYFEMPSIFKLHCFDNSTLNVNWKLLKKHDASNNIYSNGIFTNCLDGMTTENHIAISKLCKEIGYRCFAYPSSNNKKTFTNIIADTLALRNNLFNVVLNPTLDDRLKAKDCIFFVTASNSADSDFDLDPESGKEHKWIIDGWKFSKFQIDKYHRVNDPNMGITGEWQYVSTSYETREFVHHNWGFNGKYNGWFNVGLWQADQAYSYDDGSKPAKFGLKRYDYMSERKIFSVTPDPTGGFIDVPNNK